MSVSEPTPMRKLLSTSIGLLLLVAAVATASAQQPTAAKTAEEESVRRDEAKILLRQKLKEGQAAENRQEKIKNAELVQEGRFFYEMGKLDVAEEKLKQSLRKDPSNKTASYYLSLVMEAEHTEEARKRVYVSKNALVEVERSW